MARLITVIAGARDVPLPSGWNLSEGDARVVTDEIWKQILSDDRVASNIVDLGPTTDPQSDPPSWAGLQRHPNVVIPHSATLPPSRTPIGAVVFRERV